MDSPNSALGKRLGVTVVILDCAYIKEVPLTYSTSQVPITPLLVRVHTDSGKYRIYKHPATCLTWCHYVHQKFRLVYFSFKYVADSIRSAHLQKLQPRWMERQCA